MTAEAIQECRRVKEARSLLPSNRELAQRYGVSLHNINHAMDLSCYKQLNKGAKQ
jgi:DNA-binding transcriptional MocR family regulator